MGILIDTEDFQNEEEYGKYYIPFNTNLCGSEEQLKGYIKRYEEDYIYQLLGVQLGTLFIADLVNQVPQSPIYQAIYNPIKKDLPNNNIYINYSYKCGCQNHMILTQGMKSMLMGFIFFEYMRDQPYFKDLTGVNKKKSENSNRASFGEWGIDQFYNESISDYQQTQYYILIEKNDNGIYQEFNGKHKEIATTLF